MLGVPQVVFGLVLGLSTLFSGAVTAASARLRGEIGADWFVTTMGLVTLWNLFAFLTLFVHARVVLVSLEMAKNVFSIAVPVVWFTFVLDYTGQGDRLTRRWLAALWAIPALSFVAILTFPFHDLYHTGFSVVTESGWTFVGASPGPVAYLAAGYAYCLFAAGFWLLASLVWRRDRLFSGQAVWLLAGTLVPVSVGALAVLERTPTGWPVIPAAMTVLGIAYGYGLYRHRLLDLSPASRRIGVIEAFNDLDEGVVIVDTDWHVVAINESACEQFDCETSGSLGNDIDAVDPGLRGEGTDEEVRDLEVDSRVFEVATSPVEDARGRRIGHALSIHDVTDQRGRKQRLQVLNRVLRHNLRNDMTVVRGYANQIASGDDGPAAEMARSIDETADELLKLAEKARDIERTLTTGDAIERQVHLRPLVESVIGEVRADCPDVQVDVDVPEHLSVRTEPETLELVVCNIVENAVLHGVVEDGPAKPSADGGGTGSPAVTVRGRRTDDSVEITVRDDGPGIPPTELAAIETGTETALAHGQGLGLWLVRWGATRIGADVSFDAGDGTTVALSIPH